jgi:hypothetical protein
MNKLVLLLMVLFATESLAITVASISPTEACQRISAKLASVSYRECLSINLQLSDFNSTKGFPILIKEYPPLGNKIPQGLILLVGGSHGDELSSISIVFKWMETLERYHSGLFHWRVAPLINPDGALRKNTID